MPGNRLEADFFARPTLTVARELLGTYLVLCQARRRLTGRIVEVEAYIGEEDQACHARFGRTPRSEGLYVAPGYYYVYRVYGMYWCLNVVTEREGFPAAVLIRALEPHEGVRAMWPRRQAARRERDLCSGPGKLCQALEIDARFHGVSIEGDELWLEAGVSIDEVDVITCPRVGVDYAGECAHSPWRFYLAGSPSVSKKDRSAESQCRKNRS